MAADVSTDINEGNSKNKEFVTIDFFACSSKDSEKKLWEEKFDFLSRSSSSSNELHDLNFPPPQSPASSYSSVCTLEKVKNALDRAKREQDVNSRSDPKSSDGQMKRPASVEDLMRERDCSGGGSKMVVTVCRSCFQYLLISKDDPRCPNCNRVVSVADELFSRKKSKIDLNC